MGIVSRLREHIPTREHLAENRWLKFLGPVLKRPEFWKWSRRSVALGTAIGLFFGVLAPVAQIPLSAIAAILLRANLPAAVAGTLITNPLTAAPIYFAAYSLGSWIMGVQALSISDFGSREEVMALISLIPIVKPLMIGLVVLATVVGVTSYFLISVIWRWRVLQQRRRTTDIG